MARTGLRIGKYNFHDGDKYKALDKETVPLFAKLIEEKFAGNYANAELYANDSLAESDNAFIDGTLTITIDDDNDEFISSIMGNKITEKEVTLNTDDIAPELGYGHVIPKVYEGKREYKVEFFPRVKFTKVTSDNKTKGQSVEFQTSVLEAKVMRLKKDFNGFKEGDYKKQQTFDTYTEAITYLDKLLTPEA